MSFDKNKTMRSAERYLSQGKIRAAIGEYKLIVENDSKDFNTLNMLGDLYVKNKEKEEAVGCYARVADYYGKQGFAQKAIAIYNKISRLEPDSIIASARLAELYQSKGSFAEARTHYVALADQYQRSGKKIEALTVWKQIAELDPNNAEVYLKLAESYLQEKQRDEAVEAFTIAGTRLNIQGKHEAALTAFQRALEIRQHDFNALSGFVKAQISLGYSDEAAKTLENILEQQPYNRDILFLLTDCHLDSGNPEAAEKTVTKLIEQEPANYTKYLDLVAAYIKQQDLDAAARILAVSSEHLLIGGQSEDYLKWTTEILARNPEHLPALRLLVRYDGWNRDESELVKSLERLAESANLADSSEDEITALSQLLSLIPHKPEYAERLLKLRGGFETADDSPEAQSSTVMDFALIEQSSDPQIESLQTESYQTTENDGIERFAPENESVYENAFAFAPSETEFVYEAGETESVETAENQPKVAESDFQYENFQGSVEESAAETTKNETTSGALSDSDRAKLEKEVDSIKFYIEQGYQELAVKALDELEEELGVQPETKELRGSFGEPTVQTTVEVETPAAVQTEIKPEQTELPVAAKETSTPETNPVEDQKTGEAATTQVDIFSDFRDELALEESEANTQGDYDTHFQMAIAYSEMGLAENAISEFQDAINLVKPNDGTRRFFQCAHLLGNCFMENAMPNLALIWFQRTLETPNLTLEEQQAISYELGCAYQANEQVEKALEIFEKIYAADVNYRDIRAKMQNLPINA